MENYQSGIDQTWGRIVPSKFAAFLLPRLKKLNLLEGPALGLTKKSTAPGGIRTHILLIGGIRSTAALQP